MDRRKLLIQSKIQAALGGACTLAVATPAFALTAAQPVDAYVEIDITETCTLNTNTATMDFGRQNAGKAPAGGFQAFADIDLTCTGDSPLATITVDAGSHPSGTQRNMKAGALALTVPYKLYTDSARTTTYELTPGTAVRADGGKGITANAKIRIYGLIPADTPIPSSNGTQYSDAVQASIAY